MKGQTELGLSTLRRDAGARRRGLFCEYWKNHKSES